MKIATHNGNFHVDDVFAVALLTEFYPNAEIIRTRNQAVIDTADIVVDVGGVFDPVKMRYDHHQGGAGQRDNGVIYSAIGLLWKDPRYGQKYCDGDSELWSRIDRRLVQPIDANDNGQSLFALSELGVAPLTLHDFEHIFNPTKTDQAEVQAADRMFLQAVKAALWLLQRVKKVEADTISGEQLFMKACQASPNRHYVVLDRELPFAKPAMKLPELDYVIAKHPVNSTWTVRAIPVAPKSFASRLPFPEQWRGKESAELAKLTGVADARFCHVNGFIAGAVSREGAIRLAELSLEQLKS